MGRPNYQQNKRRKEIAKKKKKEEKKRRKEQKKQEQSPETLDQGQETTRDQEADSEPQTE